MANFQSSSGQNGNGSIWYWIIAIGLILTGFAAPVGIIMIVLKLLSDDKKHPRGVHPANTKNTFNLGTAYREETPLGARTTAGNSTARTASQTKSASAVLNPQETILQKLAKKGKRMIGWGGVLSVLFGVGVFSSLGNATQFLFSGYFSLFWSELAGLIPGFCLLSICLGILFAGLRRKKKVQVFRQYLNMIGNQKSISVSTLASATGSSPEKVRSTLEDMFSKGLFPVGYLDRGGDRLILSADGVKDQTAAESASAKESDSEENVVLQEIRAINDQISNPKLSAQIDRIGIITAKIFEYQKTHPDKSPELHSFLSYYLPTTLKILRTYAQLEQQKVSGSNITAAMERIEGMMDKVVEGFEKQLDQLFAGETMDITADVEVLERMLAKDGLSNQDGFQMQL